VLLFSGEKLVLLHETSPLSPINLSNYADFDQSKLISIKAHHGITFNFCHENSTILFCEHIRELFETVFESVAKETLTEQSISNNIDLSYDILRRIIQFGKINETDPTKLVSSVFFNPKNELIRIEKSQTNSTWSTFNPFGRAFRSSSSSSGPQNDPIPEINCSISELISFKLKNGRLLIADCIGKIELSLSSMIPGLQTVLLELNTMSDASIIPNLNVEMRKTESNEIILEAPVTNLTKYLIANYETNLKNVPLNIASKLRLRDQDKIAELYLEINSNFPNQYRATNVTILIRMPSQFVNAKLMSDYPTHRLNTTKDNHLILEITNLFGSSSTSACISVALTDLNFPKLKFHSFEISFEIADFSLAQLKIEKFKLLSLNRKSCAANRKIRTFCHSNKSFILNKVD